MLLAALAAALLTSCMESKPKSLIICYSQTGATAKVAAELQKQTGADLERIDVAEVYDGDFDATIQRVAGEMKSGFVPTLLPVKSDLSKYDIIFLAYPVWFGTYAPPVNAFLKASNLEGKKIVPVCTFGSGGLESSAECLTDALPSSTVAPGFGIRNARIQYADEELNRFLIENGYKEGMIDPLPEYSTQEMVTPDELAIYNEATSGYPYPTGEPVSVGSRNIPDGTDYLFVVKTVAPDGTTGTGKVFVSTRTGKNPEFTSVVR